MFSDNRKVVIVGTGFVGMSFAYAAMNQGICNELVLIDINKEKAKGEAMDLNHGLAFSQTSMKIYAGSYKDCSDADIVVICAGVSQKPGETRLDLLNKNTEVLKTIINPIIESGFYGIFLMASNPVDIMTRIVYELSGFPQEKVFGSGTTLDTARLRYMLGKYLSVDAKNVHAYVIGEHGDSEFVPWSQAMIATKSITDLCKQKEYNFTFDDLNRISDDVKNSAYVIIKAKQATYYGIGMALTRIVKAIFGDENSVLTVSSRLNGEYGINGVFLGLPCFVNRGGVRRILSLNLTTEEVSRLQESAKTIESIYNL